ncbi:glucose-6-phosphate isomerase [Candidatus Pelagibacter sp.]|nr:glucose-6-phosphate isomerase [Candidatus Pelagibacter sp.]
MKLTNNINFQNFNSIKTKNKIKKLLYNLLKSKNHILNSLSKSYKDSWNKEIKDNLDKYKNVILIGMGGSIMGSRAIFSFLNKIIKKNFYFIDNFNYNKIKNINKKKSLNLIISKSGNTLETIANSNTLLNRKVKNVFLTENKDNYLRSLAYKLKSDIVDHNNYIGGRYSVLSEVGMLPALLMGLDVKKFRNLNELIKQQSFMKSLINNVSNILSLKKKNKSNSVILNYDEKSEDLFYWYQQLVAESLGKKGSGILPIVSKMPQDNHSLMQSYLDGTKNNFYTFFFVNERSHNNLQNSQILKSHQYLRNKSLENILYDQYIATQNVFKKKKIPFRSFYIKKRNEESLGELFTFFMLETILIGKALNINPYDQPSVELIKIETKKRLLKA